MAEERKDATTDAVREITESLGKLFETDPDRIKREQERAKHLAIAIEKLTLVRASLAEVHYSLQANDPGSHPAEFIKENYVNVLSALGALMHIAQSAELLNTLLVANAAHELGKHKAGGGQTT